MSSIDAVAVTLDGAARRHFLLEHPFYRAWSAGTLELEDLGFYAAQYWRQVETFPTYLATIRRRLPEGAAKEVIAHNLQDERDGNHPGLWLRFAGALGMSADSLAHSRTLPETVACVNSFLSGMAEARPCYALGMLYGYESQTPDVADVKVRGLRDFYGIEGEGVDYFRVHGELDVDHARGLAGAIADLAGGEDDVAVAADGAAAGARAVWTLLDGVAGARGIC